MTLLRKNIISKRTWQIVYSLELVLVYVMWFKERRNLHVIPVSIVAYFLRRNGVSKYLVWSGLIAANMGLFEQAPGFCQ